MKAAKDRVNYEAGWTQFVDSISEFWTRFRKEGEHISGSFVGWVGAYEYTRGADDLLVYITKARNQSQHGLVALEWTSSGGLVVGLGFGGTLSSLKVYDDGTYEADATPFENSKTKHPVSYDFGRPQLPTIHDKHAKPPATIPPPKNHRESSITGISPFDAGMLGLRFYAECLREAHARFVL